jgi:hypothetical protein
MATFREDVLMRWLSGSLVLAAVSLLTACGSGSKSPVAKAAAKSAKATSMHTLTLLQETGQTSGSIQLMLEGDFNNVTKRSSFDLDLSGLARSLGDTGASSQLFTGQELSDTSTANPVYYLDLPFYSQSLPRAKAWLRFDLARLGADQRVGLMEIDELDSTDPRGQLDVLQQSSTKFTDLGQDDINGTFATHYQGQVDLQQVLARLSPTSKIEIGSLLRNSNGSTVPYNVWIGPTGYVFRVEMQIPGNAGTQDIALGLISDFSNYGKPVYVNLPPADQVTDLSVHQMTDISAVLASK